MTEPEETREHVTAASPLSRPLRKALHELRAVSQLSDCNCAPLVARVFEHVQDLVADRDRLRGLLLDLLKAFDAPEDEQSSIKRRAREELAAGWQSIAAPEEARAAPTPRTGCIVEPDRVQ